MPESKQLLRAAMRERRRALSVSQQRRAGESLAAVVEKELFFRSARRLAFYLPNDGEIDPSILLDFAHALGKHIYLPVLHPVIDRSLSFVLWRPGERLRSNRFGILEPLLRGGRRSPPWTLDLVFCPLVAFDREGNRLGMGGGFYDRTFNDELVAHRQRPLLIGLAHHFQEVGRLNTDPWDVPLHAVACDRGIVYCKRKNHAQN